MTRIFQILLIISLSERLLTPVWADTAFEDLLNRNATLIQKSSSKTIDPVLDEIQAYGGEDAARFLELWKNKKLFVLEETRELVVASPAGKDQDGKKLLAISGFISRNDLGIVRAKAAKQIKPNSGVRAKIASALAPFQIKSDDPNIRSTALDTIYRRIHPLHLEPLRQAMALENNPVLKERMEKAYVLGIITHGTDIPKIVDSIYSLAGDLSLETRAILNPLLKSEIEIAKTIPTTGNIARVIVPDISVRPSGGMRVKPFTITGGEAELSLESAYQLLIDRELVPIPVNNGKRDKVLVAHINSGYIGNFEVSSLDTDAARNQAYDYLAQVNNLPRRIDEEHKKRTISEYVFFAKYDRPQAITDAAHEVLIGIQNKVRFFTLLDLVLDGLSLASIYFLAAIGLAITFGVMRVINMAHGEFIMMGAYTGYVIQLIIPSYTLSIIVALPAAFILTFVAGVLMERLVIRHLYKRPLETLLATFGISIALQQIAKNIFGTQARPLTSPEWLDGAMVINDVLAISNIRIAIFLLSLVFLAILLYVMTRTRFGLETRAVTQNPKMASSMGINTDKINMLTFGFGSGIAGIAGVAIGLFSKVTSELGSDYIVQSFMTVVVGGVGNIWGTLAGAAMIGSLQKGIEWFNPSNTLAAQTYMIIFIILFIQFRPKGIVALKGRAADD